ncbi:hypothetical protein D918_04460, partial [Trichuris suis]
CRIDRFIPVARFPTFACCSRQKFLGTTSSSISFLAGFLLGAVRRLRLSKPKYCFHLFAITQGVLSPKEYCSLASLRSDVGKCRIVFLRAICTF